jgi:hypothetical protein
MKKYLFVWSGSKLAQFQQLAKNGSILAENQPIFWLNFYIIFAWDDFLHSL